MTDYKSNSHRQKMKNEGDSERKKKVEKVANGKVVTKNKGHIQKFTDIFISEDVDNVKSYILMDVVIPALKDAVEDVVHMLLRGEPGHKRSSSSKVSYRSYYDSPRERRETRSVSSVNYGYKEVTVDSRGEAEEVFMKMQDLISEYGLVSVADFYDIVGIKGNYTDNRYGWTNIRNAESVRLRDGSYLLKLPKAMPLD